MILNVIIGKHSNLSRQLEKRLESTVLLSTLNVQKELNTIKYHTYSKINMIFNQFQMSSKLYILDNPVEYINRSIKSTAEVLEFIKINSLKINKIIYTSSSSVYGNNISCSETDCTQPLSLHASLKVSNEQLIQKFCVDNNIDYTITRIFNMYGSDDNFSIISKIISIYKNNDILTLINRGEAIRDFIHIDDVVNSYINMLTTANIPIINIGTAEGKSILYILDYLRDNNILLKTSEIKKDELKVSISKNDLLLNLLGDNYTFKKVEEYILENING